MSVSKTIEIIFKGNDKVSGVIDTVSGGIGQLGEGISSVTSPLSGITDSILKMDAALAALAVGGLAYAFSKATDFESAVVNLEKVMSEGESFTQEMEDSVRSLSETYGESTTEIVNALGELRQSGLDTSASFHVLETSMKLARASELDVESATNLLKRTLIGYNLESERAVEVGNLWNRTSNVTNTTVGKLAEGFAIVSRQAFNAGFSLTEVSAALTSVIGVFDSGSEAGIAFSMTLTHLLNPTKEGENAIRMLTGAVGPLNESFESGKDLFEAVAIGLSKVDKQTASVAVANIVGARQAKRVQISFEDYFETLGKIGPASKQYNSLQKEVDVQNATTKASIDRLKASFEDLAITIGHQFQEAGTSVVDGGTDIERALQEIISDGTFEPIFNLVNSFAQDLGKTLSGIAEALPEAFDDVDFSGLINAFGDIRLEIKDIFQGMDLTKPEDLQKVIQFAVDSLESLVVVTKGIIGPISDFIDKIVSLIETFNNLEDGTKESSGAMLGWSKVIDSMLGPVGSILNMFKSLAVLLNVLVGIKLVKALTGYSSAFSLGLKPISKYVGGLKNLLPLLGKTGLVGAAGMAGYALGSLANSLTTEYLPSVNDAIQGTIQFIDEMFNITDLHKNFNIETNIPVVSEEVKGFIKTLDEIQEMVKVNITPDINDVELINWANDPLLKKISTEIDEANLEKNKDKVEKAFETITYMTGGQEIELTFEVDPKTLKKAQKVIDKALPEKKKIDVNIEVAKIKAQAEVVQTAFEFTAKVNIAEIEAQADIITTLSESMSSAFASTGEVISSALGAYSSDNLDIGQIMVIEGQLELENELRREALEEQKKLNSAQMEYMEAKTKAMEAGEGLINISADGLEPEIEAFMWKILEKIQIRANAESAEFLLGI